MSFLANVIFAFSSGIIAFLSPCSFPLLPAYISYYLGLREDSEEVRMVNVLKKGLLGGLTCSLGVIFTFLLIGIGVASFSNVITPQIPMLELIAGVLLIFLGFLMFLDKGMSFHFKVKPGEKKGYLNLLGFGVIYALATAGCVAPLFLGVVTIAVSTGFSEGVAIFLFYALGLSSLLITVTLLLASAKEMMMAKLKQLMGYVGKVGGVILILVGIYLLYRFITLS
ncbi:MAG: cytochrome c biogenesis protein CcdA [Hadesarchaea archaeon]|nr:cytochrome c biogenesis protein CcdA [Hadesarchaea archaeon]